MRLIVVAEVAPQQMMEMALAKDNHVVDAFSPDRTDQPLIRGGAAVGDLLAEPNHRAVGVIERQLFSAGNPAYPLARSSLCRRRTRV